MTLKQAMQLHNRDEVIVKAKASGSNKPEPGVVLGSGRLEEEDLTFEVLLHNGNYLKSVRYQDLE